MKPGITRGLGALTPETWKELYQTVEAVKTGDGRGEEPRTYRFWAVIEGSTINAAGIAIWKYSWTEKRRTDTTGVGVSSVTQGRSGTTAGTDWAVNILELGNTSTTAYGFAVTSLELDDAEGFYIGPVPTGTPVEMIMRRAADGKVSHEFVAPNRIFGSCPAGLVQELDGGEYGA